MFNIFNIDAIQQALTRHTPTRVSAQTDRNCAAVALVLAGPESDLHLCVMQRAERAGDPWSGDMAFPGGRAAEQDASLQETAERETQEEVGLVLEPSHRLGALAEVSILLRSRERLLFLSPFVYYLGESLAAFTPNEEVAEVHWIPLAHVWNEHNATSLNLPTQEVSLWYPAIDYRQRAIWGITYRVLTLFSDVIGRPLPHLEAIPGLGH